MKRVIQLNILLCLAFIFLNAIPCYGQKTTEFRLHGTIEDGYNGKVSILYISNSELVNDTVEVDNGYFFIKGNISNPVITSFYYSNKEHVFYIEPGDLNLSISSSLPYGFQLTGSKTQKEFEELENRALPLTSLRDSIRRINKKIKEYNSPQKQKLEVLLDSLSQERRSIDLNFLKMHPNSFLSLDLIICMYPDYPTDSLKKWFGLLSDNLRNSTNGNEVNKTIKLFEMPAINHPAPDFTTTSYNGEEIRLSSFRGKTVILDFWASWCVPCLKSMPHLKTLYYKYQDKGLVVIGISIDSDKTKWVKSIEKHNLNIWQQTLDIDIKSLYPIFSIPMMIVIDKNGKIITKWVGDSPAQEKEQDIFFEEYFK